MNATGRNILSLAIAAVAGYAWMNTLATWGRSPVSPLAGLLLGPGMLLLLGPFLKILLGASLSLSRLALCLLPMLLSLFDTVALRVSLPSPHNFDWRKVQILLAACALASLALILWAALVSARAHLATQSPGRVALRLIATATLVYFAVGSWSWRWTTTGDAPHYLVMTHSFAYDSDFDLANNYRDKDWKNFYWWGDLIPQTRLKEKGMYTTHRAGTPIFIVAGYRLGGVPGARLVLAMAAAVGAALLYLLSLKLGLGHGSAMLAWGLLAFSSPWLIHATSFFSELLAGYCLLLVWCAWYRVLPGFFGWLGAALLLWFNLRFYPLALVLAAVTWFKLPAARPAALTCVISLALICFQNWVEFDTLHLMASYHDHGLGSGDLFQPAMILASLLGQFIDQEYGLLVWAPAFALAFLGAWRWSREETTRFWLLVVPLFIYLLPTLVVPWWHGDMAPSRYLVPLAPLFALAAADWIHVTGGRGRWPMVLNGLAALGMASLPWFCFSKKDGHVLLKALDSFSGSNLTHWFPSLIMNNPVSYGWAMGLLLLGWITWNRNPQRIG